MKWIEDILKDKFGNSKADTDPLLDEVLWNKVATGLGSPVPGGGSDVGKMIGLTWTALGGCVLFVLGIYVGLNVNEFGNKADALSVQVVKMEETVLDNNPSKEVPLADIEEEETDILVVSPNEEALPTEYASHPLETIQSDPTTTALLIKSQDRDATQDKEPQPLGSSSQQSQPRNVPADSFSVGSSTLTSDALFVAQEVMSADKKEATLEASAEERKHPPVMPMKLRLPPGYSSIIGDLDITHLNEPSIPKYFALRTFGGITLSDFQYTNEDLRIFSDHFYAGSSAGGGIAVDFYFKNQQWSVGLGWSDYAQRLEFEHTWQTEYVDPEGIISVEVDPESGDTLAVGTGPVLVTATHHRHLRTYNHFNTLIIPFEWRKEFMISRWTLGCGFGGNLLVRTGERGHSFVDAGTLAAFDEADLPRTRISWSPVARFYAGYQFQPEWRLDASVGLGFQTMRSIEDNQDISPGLKQWDGQLRTLEISAGITRFFEIPRFKTVK